MDEQQQGNAEVDEEPAAKSQKTDPAVGADQRVILYCTICEVDLCDTDNNYLGYTCDECSGDCDVNQICLDCFCDVGFTCATCQICRCYACTDGTENEHFTCDECYDLYCKECGDPKPGKDGTKKCKSCQPWWQKNKPADAFCKYCLSESSGAKLCTKCGDRVCFRCPGFTCQRCKDSDFFRCKDCGIDPDLTSCGVCGMGLCSDCKCSCVEGNSSENNEE